MNHPGESLPVVQDEPPLRVGAIVFALWLVLFTSSSQFLIVAPVLPRIGEALAVPEAHLGTLVTGYAAAVAFFAILAGPISDRFGRRLVLRVGSISMAIALLLHGIADTFELLLSLRVLAGMASGILSGAAVAYIGDVLPYNQRGKALGWVMSGFAFGQIAGIPLGTILAGELGFQAPFVVFGVVMLVAFGGTMHVLAPTKGSNTDALSLRSGLKTYQSLLRQPELLAITIASAVMMFGVSSYIVYEPTWLEAFFKATPNQVASLFLVGGIASAISGPIAGRLSDRIGRKPMVVVSSAALSVLMAITTYLPSFNMIYGLFFIIMVAVGARVSPLNAWMTALVEMKRRGSLISMTMAAGQAGFALGAGMAGWTYVEAGYRSNTMLGAGAALGTALILWAFVPEPAPQQEGVILEAKA